MHSLIYYLISSRCEISNTPPHVETANSCVGLYIMGGPITGDTISPTQTLARICSKWLWYHITKWTLSLTQTHKTDSWVWGLHLLIYNEMSYSLVDVESSTSENYMTWFISCFKLPSCLIFSKPSKCPSHVFMIDDMILVNCVIKQNS